MVNSTLIRGTLIRGPSLLPSCGRLQSVRRELLKTLPLNWNAISSCNSIHMLTHQESSARLEIWQAGRMVLTWRRLNAQVCFYRPWLRAQERPELSMTRHLTATGS